MTAQPVLGGGGGLYGPGLDFVIAETGSRFFFLGLGKGHKIIKSPRSSQVKVFQLNEI